MFKQGLEGSKRFKEVQEGLKSYITFAYHAGGTQNQDCFLKTIERISERLSFMKLLYQAGMIDHLLISAQTNSEHFPEALLWEIILPLN